MKKIDVWNFTDEQVEKIRSRLCFYKLHAGVNGKDIPLKSLHISILTSGVTANAFPENGSLPEFKEEALRRFMRGITARMGPDKLADVYLFLVNKGYLKEAEMREEANFDIQQVLAFQAYMASPSPDSQDSMGNVIGTYSAERSGDRVEDKITLILEKGKSNDYLIARDVFERYRSRRDNKGVLTQTKELEQNRTGFGFMCSQHNFLYLFLYGATQDDLITYTQVSPNSADRDTSRIVFLRNWTDFPIKENIPEKPEVRAARELSKNIMNFERHSDSDEEVVSPEQYVS